MPKIRWLTVIATAVWIAIIIFILTSKTATAANMSISPEEYCWEQQVAFIDEGVEMATGPLETSGEQWTIVWEDGSEDLVPGNRISIPFADEVVHISGHTPAMADHLLTLNLYWARGSEPFGVRYEGTVYLIVPHFDNQSQEVWCMALPLTN